MAKAQSKITTRKRRSLPKSAFAGPGRSYPIDTRARARNAIARVRQFGTPELQRRVIGAVKRRYPGIEVTAKPGRATVKGRSVPTTAGLARRKGEKKIRRVR